MSTSSPGENSELVDLAIRTMETLVKQQPQEKTKTRIKLESSDFEGDDGQNLAVHPMESLGKQQPLPKTKIPIKVESSDLEDYETTAHHSKSMLTILSAAAEHCESSTGDKSYNMLGRERKDINNSKLKNKFNPNISLKESLSTSNNVNRATDSQVNNINIDAFDTVNGKPSETVKQEQIIRSPHVPVMISSHLMQGRRHVSKTSVLHRGNLVETKEVPMPTPFAQKLLARKYGIKQKSLNRDKECESMSGFPLNNAGCAGEMSASETMEACEVQHPRGSETEAIPVNSEVLQGKKLGDMRSLLRGLLTDATNKGNSSSLKTDSQQLEFQDQNVHSRTCLDSTLEEKNQGVCSKGLNKGESNNQEQLSSRKPVASPTLATFVSQQSSSPTSYIFVPQIGLPSSSTSTTVTLQKASNSFSPILITPKSASLTPSTVIPKEASKSTSSNVISQESSNTTYVTPKEASETTRSTVTPLQTSGPYPVTLMRPKSSSPTSPTLLLQPTSTPSVIPPQNSSPAPSSVNPQEPGKPAPIILISQQGSSPAPFHLVPQGMCIIPAPGMTEGNAKTIPKVSLVPNMNMNPTTNLGSSSNLKLLIPQGRFILPSPNAEQVENVTGGSEVPVSEADSANPCKGEFLKVFVSPGHANTTAPNTSSTGTSNVPQGKLGPLKPGRTKTKTVPLYCLNPDDFANEEDKLRICKAKNAKRNRDGIKKKLQLQQRNLDIKQIQNNVIQQILTSAALERDEEKDRTAFNKEYDLNMTLQDQIDEQEPEEKKLRIALSDSEDSDEKEKQMKARVVGSGKFVKVSSDELEKQMKARAAGTGKFVKAVDDDIKSDLNTELRMLEAKVAELRKKIDNQHGLDNPQKTTVPS